MSFLAALARKNQGKIPIWLMRQAGRYLPTYHTFKRRLPLLDMFHDVQTIVEVTELPLHYLPLDAAILFSDILTVLDGLGVPYQFKEGIGPVIQFDRFRPKNHAYGHISEAIFQLKNRLSVPLIGFAGAPFTIASYLIEGQTTKQFLKAKRFLFEQPVRFTELITQVTDETIAYLDVQIQAGVDAIQLFDSWAHFLAPTEFNTFALEPLKRIVRHVKALDIPLILFSKAASLHYLKLAELSPDAISLDWAGDLPTVRRHLPRQIALQGNLDPSVLFASPQKIEEAVDAILEPMLGDPAFIFNLGHGVLPETPFEHVKHLVHYVNDRSRAALQAP